MMVDVNFCIFGEIMDKELELWRKYGATQKESSVMLGPILLINGIILEDIFYFPQQDISLQ